MARKLLLADDSITIQKVVELVLSEEDFQIKAVSNGNEALNQLESYKPDIVLADIEMPEVNGYQLCDRIKKNPVTANIAVILLAGAFEPLDEDLAKNVGADDHIIKPFESQELINKINAVIQAVGEGGVVAEAEAAPVPEEVAVEEPMVVDAVNAEVASVEMVEEAAEIVTERDEDLWEMEEAEMVETKAASVWEAEEISTFLPEEAEAIIAAERVRKPAEEAPAVEEAEAAGEITIPDELEAVEEQEIEASHAEVAEAVAPPSAIELPATEEAVLEEPAASPVTAETVKVPEEVSVTEAPVAAIPEVKMPSEVEIANIIRESIDSKIATTVGGIDISSMVSEAVMQTVRPSVEKMMAEMIPTLIKQSITELLQDSLSPINKQIENIIWETVPDLAENLIKKEIEKIKSEY